MSEGISFQQFMSALRDFGFPVDKVSGGDIYSVYKMRVDVKDAALLLHSLAETRRKMKQSTRIPE